jgi:DNA-binding PadR family transcriptional regulator
MDASELSGFLPLSPAALHILLCLAGGPRHAYAILQEAAKEAGGQYKLGPGTLYDNLKKVMEQGMVEEGVSPNNDDDPRRGRYYQLTDFGRQVLKAEVERLKLVVRKASVRLRRLGAESV